MLGASAAMRVLSSNTRKQLLRQHCTAHARQPKREAQSYDIFVRAEEPHRMCLGLVRDAAEARDSPGTSIPLKLQVTHKAQRRTAALLWPFRICTGNRLSSSRGYDSQPTRGQDQFGRDPTRSDGEPMVQWQGLRVVTPPRSPTPRPPLPLSVLPSAQPAMHRHRHCYLCCYRHCYCL